MASSGGSSEEFRSDPDGDIFLSIIFKGQLFKALKAAVKFGVFEVLEAHTGTGLTTGEFVSHHGFDKDNITALLECLCYLKLVKRERNAEGEWLYTNTRATRKYGLMGKPPTMAGLILQDDMIAIRKQRPGEGMFHSNKNDGTLAPEKAQQNASTPSQQTTDVTKETSNQKQTHQAETPTELPKQPHGSPPSDPTAGKKWSDADVLKMLMTSMDGCLAPSVSAILSAFDLSGHKVAVDLGGGAGRLSVALKEKYPNMEVTNFDIPAVCQLSKGFLGEEKSKTIKYVPGDFFTDDLPEADLYLMGHVLHDWTEAKGHVILTKVFKALAKGGTILVLEKLLDSERLEPEGAIAINTILTSNTLGFEVGEDEYRARLTRAGFADFRAKRIPGYNFYDVIMAKKP